MSAEEKLGEDAVWYFGAVGMTPEEVMRLGTMIRPREWTRHGVTPGGIEWRG